MNASSQFLASWMNRPLAILPEFARSPNVNTKPTAPGLTDTGVAVIPISGALTSDQSDRHWGVQSYSDIRRTFVTAVRDPAIAAVALLIDSPGGTVSGCFDLADTIYSARGIKPIHAILNENAYSAAYALASAADQITIPRTGGAGSIGVLAVHADISELLAKNGIKLTAITYGAHKADGQPFQPLTDDMRGRIDAEIQAAGDLFVETVARNRGLATATVRGTEAGKYRGLAAVQAGLADAVAAPDAAFRRLLATF